MSQIRIIKKMLVGEREPEQVINDEVAGVPVPYLNRWFVRKDSDGIGNIYLHQFLHSDYERALHDHPWQSVSFILDGIYKEHLADRTWVYRKPGDIVVREALHAHRVELLNGEPVWSLFITGPKVREWGFYCSEGWTHWTEFNQDKCS